MPVKVTVSLAATTPSISATAPWRIASAPTVLSADDFDAEVAERYGLVNRTLDDGDLDSFVDALARRPATFDRETLGAAKGQINRFGVPTATGLQSSTDTFFSTMAWPTAQARRAKPRNLGYGVPSDFELNFGSYLPALGPAGDDGTGALSEGAPIASHPKPVSPLYPPRSASPPSG